jgi:thiol-disulfide isomerase/thioredoxin
MKLKALPHVVLGAILALGTVGWLIMPGAFGRGVIVGLFGALAVIVGGVVVFGRIMRKRIYTKLKPPPLPTGSWDYSMDVTDLDGVPVSAEHWAGKVLVLNFWGTWCAPCVAELPSLRRLLDQTADLGVQFGFITREDASVVRQFLDRQGIDLPVYLLRGEPPECFTTRAIPATFVLDRAGSVVMRHLGAAAWDEPSAVAFVRGLAATPAA